MASLIITANPSPQQYTPSENLSPSSSSGATPTTPPPSQESSSPYTVSRFTSLLSNGKQIFSQEKAEALVEYLTIGGGAKKIQTALDKNVPQFAPRNIRIQGGGKLANAPESMFFIPTSKSDGTHEVVVYINLKGGKRLGGIKKTKITILTPPCEEKPLIVALRLVTLLTGKNDSAVQKRAENEFDAYIRLEKAGYRWMPVMHLFIDLPKYGNKYQNQIMEKFTQDLFQFLKKQLKPSETHWIVDQLINAFKDLHDLGFAHRDVKEENIVIDLQAKRIALIDLEMLSHTTDPFAQQCGTVSFFSPEKCERQECDLLKSDVYALGIVLARLCLGWQPAWVTGIGLSDVQRMTMIKDKIYYDNDGNLITPKETSPELKPLRDLIATMCNYDPNKRPSMQEVLTNWEAYKHILEARPSATV